MTKERPKVDYEGPVEGISIPDEEVRAWKTTLLELGWPLSFVDRFLIRMNDMYGTELELKERDGKMIDRLLYYQNIKKERPLTEPEEREFEQMMKILTDLADPIK